MIYRIYYIDQLHPTKIISCKGEYASLDLAIANFAKNYFRSTALAWEDGAVSTPIAQVAKWEHCLAAFNRTDGGFAEGEPWMVAYFGRDKVRSLGRLEANPPVKAKRGQTEIVQEWVRTIDEKELAKRAWAATMAIAKGN